MTEVYVFFRGSERSVQTPLRLRYSLILQDKQEEVGKMAHQVLRLSNYPFKIRKAFLRFLNATFLK